MYRMVTMDHTTGENVNQIACPAGSRNGNDASLPRRIQGEKNDGQKSHGAFPLRRHLPNKCAELGNSGCGAILRLGKRCQPGQRFARNSSPRIHSLQNL
jgi:hypothetical protein